MYASGTWECHDSFSVDLTSVHKNAIKLLLVQNK
jgi:hypothetical protein